LIDAIGLERHPLSIGSSKKSLNLQAQFSPGVGTVVGEKHRCVGEVLKSRGVKRSVGCGAEPKDQR
jgi:hypothetical protein